MTTIHNNNDNDSNSSKKKSKKNSDNGDDNGRRNNRARSSSVGSRRRGKQTLGEQDSSIDTASTTVTTTTATTTTTAPSDAQGPEKKNHRHVRKNHQASASMINDNKGSTRQPTKKGNNITDNNPRTYEEQNGSNERKEKGQITSDHRKKTDRQRWKKHSHHRTRSSHSFLEQQTVVPVSQQLSTSPAPKRERQMRPTRANMHGDGDRDVKEIVSSQRQTQSGLITTNPLEWEIHQAHNNVQPSKRGFHTCTYVEGEHKLYIIGGDSRKVFYNDMWTYDIETRTWTLLPSEMQLKKPITGHTCTLYNGRIYLFGGKQGGDKYCSDLYIFDLKTRKWELHLGDEVKRLTPRGGHAATVVGNKWYIFGGITAAIYAERKSDDLEYLNTLIVFDLENHKWSVPNMKGTLPEARAGHSLVSVGTDIYLFGGRMGTTMLGDLYVLDTTVMMWSKVETKGKISPRAGHTMTAISANLIVLYGGTDWARYFKEVRVLDLRNMRWIRFPTTGRAPQDRFWHSCVMVMSKLIVFGGGSLGISLFDDLFTLDLTNLLKQDPTPLQAVRQRQDVSPPPSPPSPPSPPLSTKEHHPPEPQDQPPILPLRSPRQPNTFKVKTEFGTETRVFTVPDSISYAELHDRLCKEYSSTVVTKYKDDEGDQVTIRSDAELQDAIAYFHEKGERLRLQLTVDTSRKESSSAYSTPIRPFKRIRYQYLKEIGDGASCTVHKVLDLDTAENLAMKVISISESQHIQVDVVREIQILESLKHENIVRYVGVERDEDNIKIFLEYAEGSLWKSINETGALTESVIRKRTRDILFGLRYLHDKGVIHRDLKSGNVLLGPSGICKISDFGQSTNDLQNEERRSVGTTLWKAPETIRTGLYSKKSDIWSLGCTVLEMFTGKPPWPEYHHLHMRDAELIIASKNEPPKFPAHASSSAKKFLSKCLAIDEELRSTADELLQEDFIVNNVQRLPDYLPNHLESSSSAAAAATAGSQWEESHPSSEHSSINPTHSLSTGEYDTSSSESLLYQEYSPSMVYQHDGNPVPTTERHFDGSSASYSISSSIDASDYTSDSTYISNEDDKSEKYYFYDDDDDDDDEDDEISFDSEEDDDTDDSSTGSDSDQDYAKTSVPTEEALSSLVDRLRKISKQNSRNAAGENLIQSSGKRSPRILNINTDRTSEQQMTMDDANPRSQSQSQSQQQQRPQLLQQQQQQQQQVQARQRGYGKTMRNHISMHANEAIHRPNPAQSWNSNDHRTIFSQPPRNSIVRMQSHGRPSFDPSFAPRNPARYRSIDRRSLGQYSDLHEESPMRQRREDDPT